MTDDPRINILAQAAGERIGNVDPGYYKMAAKEFLAFADALEEHYYAGAMPAPVEASAPEPAYPVDVREERTKTAAVITRRISNALRLVRVKADENNEPQAGGAMAIAIELQALLDELA